MRLLLLISAGLAYASALVLYLPHLLSLPALIPSSWNRALLLTLWPAPPAAVLWVVLAGRKGVRPGRAEVGVLTPREGASCDVDEVLVGAS